MDELRILTTQGRDLQTYIDILEEVRDWLEARGLTSQPKGIHQDSSDCYFESINSGEVFFAWLGDDIVGSFRLLNHDEIVWPEAPSDALYLHSLVVRRQWSGMQI